jgi:hypothetical protein
MPAHKKKLLTVLIEKEKHRQFAQLCSSQGHTMAWMVNGFIDRCLAENLTQPQPTDSNQEPLQESLESFAEEDYDDMDSSLVDTVSPLTDEERTITAAQEKFIAEVKRYRELGISPGLNAQIERRWVDLGLPMEEGRRLGLWGV